MQHDRKITISAAGSRRATHWPAQDIMLSELWARLQTPARGIDTMEAYLRLPKSEQDSLKDVGGFVAGSLADARRKTDAVQGRDVLTLDLDNIPAGGTEDILRRVEGLGCGYCIYSTRKHRPDAPRLRVLLPLDRTASADEYEPLARRAAAYIDPALTPFDATTFEPARLMYWPSCCADSAYIYRVGDKPFLSADGVLAQYTDWRDSTAWPEVPGAAKLRQRQLAKAGDPREKGGVVGAFCRIYTVQDALERLLPGVYVPTEHGDRWTYAGGSTTGGALIYDGGKFLYSHHATDPAGGRLLNAFDLVRVHLFGDRDADALPDTPIGRLPSYKAMLTFARQDGEVEALLNRERYESAVEDFASDGEPVPRDTDWMRALAVEDSGKYARTIRNVMLMLEGDPRLKGRIRHNAFTDRVEGMCPLPWAGRNAGNAVFLWEDSDDAGLWDCVEQLLGFRTRDAVSAAVIQVSRRHAHNPVVDYLTAQTWDGTMRLDTFFIDYFGEEDSPYTRAVARKSLTAAVARAMNPGCKYDYMPVLCGPQGIYKSTALARLGGAWFSDSIRSFDDKDDILVMLQNWIVEVAELNALNRSEINTVKQTLSRQADDFRAPYGHNSKRYARHCVFFGTTNDTEYLKDPTGSRRFWPIDCRPARARLSVREDLTEETVAQLWAEAFVRYRAGEPLTLCPEDEKAAELRRQQHTESDELEGQIEAFLARPVPEDWLRWDASRRAMFLNGELRGDTITLVHRDRICALEVLRECLGDRRGVIPQRDTRRVNAVLQKIAGWKPGGRVHFGAAYGQQRGFVWDGKTTPLSGYVQSDTALEPSKSSMTDFVTV